MSNKTFERITKPLARESTVKRSVRNEPVGNDLTGEQERLKGMTVRPTATPVIKTVKRSFVLFQPNAQHVAVCGEFNGWSPDATPLRRQGNNRWETILALEPGRYQYKFLVDGEWIPDPLAQENVPNQYGSLNSVIVIRP